ncbi:MAG: thymidine kinase [Fusobacteria bacterium]|nr:thymidine kinase [Fusobacteriota bacterium]
MLETICGSMFSGKSSELIRRIKRAKIARQNVVLFKPAIDVRYDHEKVVTHDKNSLDAKVVSTVEEMKYYISEDVDVVGIDEVQFFNHEVVEYADFLANKGIRVVIAGLDQDYLGKPFKITSELMSISEKVTKLNAICMECGADASKTYKVGGTKNRIEVGVDNYIALCRHCYNHKSEAN